MGMKIDDLQFLQLLPVFMREDEAAIALSKAVSRLFSEPGAHIEAIRVWDKIDELTSSECDELAWELDIDWYDSSSTLEQKRETIKDAQKIKRKRGTKWAVERLISIYFGAGYVMEWFDVPEGNPFDFYVLTTNTEVVSEDYNKFIAAAKAAKNTRSHIAGVFYYWEQGPDPGVAYSLETKLRKYNHKRCGTAPRTATIGLLVKPSVEVDPAVELHKYAYTAAGTHDCGTYPRTATKGAAIRTAAAASPEVSASLYNHQRQAGQYPRRGTLGNGLTKTVAASLEAAFLLYSFTKCGTRRCGQRA